MSEADKKLEQIVLTRLLRLNAKVQGLVTGIVLGLGVFVATNWLILKAAVSGPEKEPVVGPHLALLGQYFIGYRVSFLGSVVGFGYGFVLGSVIGCAISVIYNSFVDLKERRSQSSS